MVPFCISLFFFTALLGVGFFAMFFWVLLGVAVYVLVLLFCGYWPVFVFCFMGVVCVCMVWLVFFLNSGLRLIFSFSFVIIFL